MIASAFLVLLTVAGWFVSKTKDRSSAFRDSVIAATNVSGSAFVQGSGNTVTVDNSTHLATPNVIPDLPNILIETLDGVPPEFSDNSHLRLSRLVVRNSSDVAIESFCSRLQLPEPISETLQTNLTPGTTIGWHPLVDRIVIKGTGGRTQSGLWLGPTSRISFVEEPMAFFPRFAKGEIGTFSRAGDLTGVWELNISRLPPGGYVSLSFLSSNDREGTNYIAMASVPLWSLSPNPQRAPNTNELRYSFEGEYGYAEGAKMQKQHFLVPIIYDDAARLSYSLPIQKDCGKWHPVTLVFQ